MRFDPGYFGGNRKTICHMGVLAMQDSAQITRAEGGYFLSLKLLLSPQWIAPPFSQALHQHPLIRALF